MKPYSSRAFAEFNRLLASAIDRGLPLQEAVSLIAAQAPSRRFRVALEGVSATLREGTSFSDALRRHPTVFSEEYCAWVALGLRSGRLANLLRQAGNYYRLLAQVNARLRSIAAYLIPLAVLCGPVVAVVGYFSREFREVLAALGVPLPFLTRQVLWICDEPLRAILVLTSPVLLLVVGFCVMRRLALTSRFEYALPGWGQFQKNRDLSLFCAAMALRLHGETPAPEALRSARNIMRNRHLRAAIERMVQGAQDGEPLSSVLFYERFFPRTLAWAVSLGEARGEVAETFETFSRIHAGSMQMNAEILLVLLTPLGILAVGNVLTCILLAYFFPIFELQEALSH